jgi:hypothetical protein
MHWFACLSLVVCALTICTTGIVIVQIACSGQTQNMEDSFQNMNTTKFDVGRSSVIDTIDDKH